jgi:hypothetical protein
VVKHAGKAITWAAFGAAAVGSFVTIIYGWLPDSSRVALACASATIAIACFWRACQLWPRNRSKDDSSEVVPSDLPDMVDESVPTDDEIKILQMFVEFKGDHTSEDVSETYVDQQTHGRAPCRPPFGYAPDHTERRSAPKRSPDLHHRTQGS